MIKAKMSEIISERRPYINVDSAGGQFSPRRLTIAGRTHVNSDSGKLGAPKPRGTD